MIEIRIMKFLHIDKEQLNSLVTSQLNSFFNDGSLVDGALLKKYQADTIDRLHNCFTNIKKPYFFENNKTIFNHLHGDHYAMYLYLLCNTIWKLDKNEKLASKVFLLNKALHGVDAFYGIDLPEIFLFVHPLGTVLGRAKYSDYFVVYQNCNVGANEDLIYPTFKGETLLYSKATIIGSCKVGSNTVFGANSFVMNTNIKDNSTVVGSYPNNKIIDNNKNVIDRMFN